MTRNDLAPGHDGWQVVTYAVCVIVFEHAKIV